MDKIKGKKGNYSFDIPSILEKEEIKERVLKSQERMQRALAQAMKIGWDQMNEEERRMIINLGLLAEKLGRELRETFKKEEN